MFGLFIILHLIVLGLIWIREFLLYFFFKFSAPDFIGRFHFSQIFFFAIWVGKKITSFVIPSSLNIMV